LRCRCRGCRMEVGRGRRASRWVARVLLYGGALALAAFLCRERLLAEGGEATAPAARPGPAASLLAVPPSEMRSGLRTAYRLRPDARRLGALSQVYALLTGTRVLPVAATSGDGQWRLPPRLLRGGRAPGRPAAGRRPGAALHRPRRCSPRHRRGERPGAPAHARPARREPGLPGLARVGPPALRRGAVQPARAPLGAR